MTADAKAEKTLQGFLKELGPSNAIERFLRNYDNVKTRSLYGGELCLYIRWLKGKRDIVTPDWLIEDNLKCVFESRPTDLSAKRTHTDFLAEYINIHLIQREDSESKRSLAAAAIRSFYESNDSALFGHWKRAELKPEAPSPPLRAEDIRKVLLAMPMRMRTPLVLAWQSGIEINRILELDWRFALGKAAPVRVELTGRKGHRKGYSTFIGTDGAVSLNLAHLENSIIAREASRTAG